MTTMLLAVLSLAAQDDLAAVRQSQKRVQLETEQTVRRIHTMLRALSYHRLDTVEENRVLEELAVSLAGLSREQMDDVLRRLEAAAKSAEDGKARAETEAAYAKHREVVDALGRLLERYDSVRSLDQAAERLERLAQDELELHLQAVHLARVGQQLLSVDRAEEAERKKLEPGPDFKVLEKGFIRRRDQRGSVRGSVHAMAARLPDEQADVRRSVSEILARLAELRKTLPAEQVERLSKAEALATERQTVSAIEEAGKRLKSGEGNDKRYASWKAGAFLQWKSAGDLRELARSLRSPVEDLEVLREARRRIEESIERQSGLRTEATLPPESKEVDRVERRGREFGDRQARTEFEVRDTRVLLMPRRPESAAKIGPAETAMKDAQALLRDGAPAQAEQERAIVALRSALDEVERQIAEAEQAVTDPVAELKKLSDSIEKLIQEQKQAKERAEAEKKPEALAGQAPKQAELAARTEGLKQDPAAGIAGAQSALAKAGQAMEQAAEALEDGKQVSAVARQDEAIQALEEAKEAAELAQAAAEKAQQELLPTAAQQVAKAIEQAQAAQQANQESAKAAPSLAEAQKELANQAEKANQPAAPDARKAAEALEQGKLPQAIEDQKQALEEFQRAAAKEARPGHPHGPAHPMAEQQQALLQATRQAAHAHAAQAQAQHAAAQAHATAPKEAHAALAQAQAHLGKAQRQSREGRPHQAAESDAEAVQALLQALAKLNSQLEKAGLPRVHPGKPSDAQAHGGHPGKGKPHGKGPHAGKGKGEGKEHEPGQGQSKAPGQGKAQTQGQGQSPQAGKSQEQNASKGGGNREPDGMAKNDPSQLQDVKGGTSFLHLPPRQRDLIRQALNDTLPAEYSALIQQYYVNLARGRSAGSPATGEKPK